MINGLETRKYIRWSNNTAVSEVPVLFSFSYYSHVFRWRYFTIYIIKTFIQTSRYLNRMWQACCYVR